LVANLDFDSLDNSIERGRLSEFHLQGFHDYDLLPLADMCSLGCVNERDAPRHRRTHVIDCRVLLALELDRVIVPLDNFSVFQEKYPHAMPGL
jgi:hypothetical protein